MQGALYIKDALQQGGNKDAGVGCIKGPSNVPDAHDEQAVGVRGQGARGVTQRK
jgi:hypothetical protein